MEEREGFVKNSKVAIKGFANGLFGSIIYELLLSVLISIIVTVVLTNQNPGATQDELNILSKEVFSSFPLSIIISCLSSFITLVIFTFIIGFKDFLNICKRLLDSKTIKYGILGAIVIMFFSIVYNSSIISIFNLDSTGNSNQENVVELIKSNIYLGFLSVVIFAPAVEELTYRYCLFGLTSKKKKWIGYLVSGLVFGLMHCLSSVMEYGFTKDLLTEMLYAPPYIFSGLVLCYLYDHSNNLGSSFNAHFINNLISFLGIICL